jgi:DNA polymerase I
MSDKIVLLDGNSLVHRAFHALPPLTNTSGELLNATYGFTMMLLRAIGDIRPTHVATCFDTPRPTFRHQRFGAYKATRPPMAEGLGPQFGRVDQVLDVLHIHSYRHDGLEADDLLGTLADRSAEQGLEVVVVSGDNDAFQLVGPSVKVLALRRGVTDTVLYDEAGIRERYGLEPRQLIDLRALRGDVTDNIPGIPGIGDKTAAQLLAAYGDIEGVIENLDKLPQRQRDQLSPYVDQMRLSRDLAEIVRDAPIEFNLQDCILQPPDHDRAVALFHELAFRQLIDRLPSIEEIARGGKNGAGRAGQRSGSLQGSLFDTESTETPPVPTGPPTAAVCSLDELRDRARRLQEAAEPVGLILLLSRADVLRADILGIAIGNATDGALYSPCAGPADGDRPLDLGPVLKTLRPLLEDPRVPKVSTNIKQAMVALARHGIVLRGGELDLGLAAYLIESSQRTVTIQDLSWTRLNRELPSIKAVTGEGRSALALDAVPVGKIAEYLGQQVTALIEISPILQRELVDEGLEELYRDVELPLVNVLAAMEQAGIAIDVPYLQELSRELYERISKLEAGIFESVGHEFNIGSPQQLANVLFDELKLPGAKRTSTGRASTAADVLSGLRGAHDVIDLILEHRELTKLKSTYVDALPLIVHPDTGRVHTTFNQTVAATGRLSSQDPNLQNIPVRTELGRRVRRAFIAPEPGWKIVSADYSQIELRIQAHLTQDPILLEAFRAGEDIHVATAAELHGVPLDQVTRDMRGLAKTANFAMMYGVSPFGLAEQTGLTQHDAAEFIHKYFERFHGVETFQKRLIKEARETGTVMTLLGRKRTIPELQSRVYAVRAAGERMAINAPVQGSASDIIKKAMIELYDYLVDNGMRSRMLLQVHDELLFEAPDEEIDDLMARAKEIMEGALVLTVPLVVDFRVAENWGAMY